MQTRSGIPVDIVFSGTSETIRHFQQAASLRRDGEPTVAALGGLPGFSSLERRKQISLNSTSNR